MDGLERAIEVGARYVAKPVAQVAQWMNDACPFSFEDTALVGVVGVLASAALYTRAGSAVRRKIRTTMFAGVVALGVHGATIGLTRARPDAYVRFSLEHQVMDVQTHYEVLRMTADTAVELEREHASQMVVPKEAVCAQVVRFLRAQEQPVVVGKCSTKSSVLFRYLNRRGYATGWFDPVTRDTMLALDANNYWYPFFLGHEIAHRNLILTEDQADFVAYAALSTADGPYALPLRQVAAVWRAKSTQLSLAALTGEVFPWVAPARAQEDYPAVSVSIFNPTGTVPPAEIKTRPPVVIPEGSSVQEKPVARARFARYDGGYLALAQAWDVAHGRDISLPDL